MKFKRVSAEREIRPESPEEDARTEKLLEQLTLVKREILLKEGFLWRKRKEEEEGEEDDEEREMGREAEANWNGGDSIALFAALSLTLQ